jgi:putative transcriptional regulator
MAIIVRLDRVLADRKVRGNELARAIGITPSNLSLLKSGKVKGIKFETLDAICEVLGCQPGDILEHAPNGREVGPELEEPRVLRRAG